MFPSAHDPNERTLRARLHRAGRLVLELATLGEYGVDERRPPSLTPLSAVASPAAGIEAGGCREAPPARQPVAAPPRRPVCVPVVPERHPAPSSG